MRVAKPVAGRTNTLAELRQRLNKKFGDGTALSGKQISECLAVRHYSTGFFALDVGLRGGFPFNRIVEIIGAEGSTKSSLCLASTVGFQASDPKAITVYINLENALDPAWMTKLKCDFERIIVVHADCGEQAGDIVDEVVSNAAVPVQMIVDSIMALVPMCELESTLDQKFMGQQPALINRIIRVANARIKKSIVGECARSSLILVNQTRPEIGGNTYAPDIGHSSGGQGRKFFSSQRIVLSSSTPEKFEKDGGIHKMTTRFGKKVNFQIIKNKCGGPEETGTYQFYNRSVNGIPIGVDDAAAIVNLGLLYNVLHKNGNTIKYGKTDLGASIDKAVVKVRTNLSGPLLTVIKNDIMAAAREEFGGDADVRDENEEKQESRAAVRFKLGGKTTTLLRE